MTRYLVTGGAGFIGFNLVPALLAREPACEVKVLDKLTYAGTARSLAELRIDIGDRDRVRELYASVRLEIPAGSHGELV